MRAKERQKGRPIQDMILDDIEPTDARGEATRKRSKFASIFRYAPTIVRQLEIYGGSIVTAAIAWKRAKFAACRGDAASRRRCVRYTPWSCTAVLVACSEDKKKGRKSTLADPRQYANTAIKRDALFLSLFSPSLFPRPAFNYLSRSLYLVRCRYKQAHNVGAKMPTDGIPVPLPRRPHALAHPEPLMKPPTMLAFIGFHRFSSVSRSAWYVRGIAFRRAWKPPI